MSKELQDTTSEWQPTDDENTSDEVVDERVEDTQPADESDEQIPDESEGGEQEGSRFDTDLTYLAGAYGLNDDDLSSFESEAELRRYMQIEDRKMAAQVQLPPPEEKPGEVKEEPAKTVPQEIDFDLEQFAEDDPVRIGFQALMQGREQLTKEVESIKQMFQSTQQQQAQAQHESVVNWFDTKLDELGSDIYGKGSGRSVVQGKEREKVWNLLTAQCNQIIATGQQPDYDIALKRAMNGIHGSALKSLINKTRVDAIKSRSRQRTGTGRSRGSVASTNGFDGPITENPAVLEALDKI